MIWKLRRVGFSSYPTPLFIFLYSNDFEKQFFFPTLQFVDILCPIASLKGNSNSNKSK